MHVALFIYIIARSLSYRLPCLSRTG